MSKKPTTIEEIRAFNDWERIFRFNQEQSNKDFQIDPNDELDWYSITLGFFLAKGLDVKTAHDLSLYVRYDTDFG